MSVTRHTYATREALNRAAGWNGTPADADRLLDSHSGKVEELFHRHFFPRVYTRRYDWPSRDQVSHAILWLDDDLLTVTTFTADGTAISSNDYYLGPDDPDLPSDRIELDATSTASFGGGGQRSLEVLAVWGYCQDTAPAGTAASAINGSVTALSVSDASLVGVGDLLLIGTERLIVADRSFVTTTATLGADLGGSNANDQLTASNGALVKVGETILIDSEEMLVTAIASNTVNVLRAQNGTALDTHSSGATIYAPRSLTVVRGAYGTTAASHSQGDAITRNVPPGLITDLVIAECIAQRQQETSGYAATSGLGGQSTPDRIALLDLRARCREAYMRNERVAL